MKMVCVILIAGFLSAITIYADVTITDGASNIGELNLNTLEFTQSHPTNWIPSNTKVAMIGYDTRTTSASVTIDGNGTETNATAEVMTLAYSNGITASLTVNGPNARYTAAPNGAIVIGSYGSATMVVTNGAFVEGKATALGWHTGSDGLLIVTGSNTYYNASFYSTIGDEGFGRLIVTDGATFFGGFYSDSSISTNNASSIDIGPGATIFYRSTWGYNADTMSGFLDLLNGSDNIRIWNGSEYVHYSQVTEDVDFYVYKDGVFTYVKCGRQPVVTTPTGQTVTNLALRSAVLNWTETSTSTVWEVEYGTNGFTQGSGTTVSITDNPTLPLTGLEPGASYDWYVLAENDLISDWAGPDTFTTRTLLDSYEDDFSADTGTNYLSNGSSYWSYNTTNDELDFSGPSTNEWTTYWYMLSRYEHPTNANAAITATFDASDYDMNGQIGLVIGGNATDPDGQGFMVYADSSDRWRLITPENTDCPPLGNDQSAGVVLDGFMSGSGTYTIRVVFDRETAPTGKVNIQLSIERPGAVEIRHSGTYDDLETANQVGFRTRYSGSPRSFSVSRLRVGPVTCPKPTDQTVSGITDSSAQLGWTENGTATTWQVEIGESGFTPTGTATYSNLTSNPCTVTNLNSGTTYDWYVRSDNGGGDDSLWAGPHSFMTLYKAPYSQYFDGVPANGSLPTSWTSIENTTAAPQASVITYAGGYSSPYMASLYNYTDSSAELLLISPEFYDMGNQQNRIRFYAKGSGSVLVGTISDPTNAATFSSLQSISLTSTWTEHTISLASYSGSDRRIAFKHPNSSTYQNIGIDNFHYEIIAEPAPTTQGAANFTENSADLSWSQSGSPNSWSIEYGESGFVKGSGTVITDIDATEYTLTNLTYSTDYQWYVRAVFVSGESVWTGPDSFTTAEPAFSQVYTQDFDSVTAPALPDYWSKIEESGNTANYYVKTVASQASSSPNCVLMKRAYDPTDLYLITPSLNDLTSCQVRFKAKSNGYGTTLVVGTFTDPSDSATFTPFQTNTLTSSYAEYTVPFGDYTGSDRYVGFEQNADVYFAGTYIDDFVYEHITPSDQTESNLTYNSVTLNWTQNGDVSLWDVKWGASGFDPATAGTLIDGLTVSFHALSDLPENTAYDWYVRADYGADGSTRWIGPSSFTTSEQFPSPSDQSTSGIEHNSASLSWTQPSGSPSAWQIKWGADGFDIDTEGTLLSSVGSSPYALPGLSENTDYNWYVRANYGNGNYSSWTGPDSFSTPDSCPAPTGQTESSLEYNSVELGWTENGSAVMWDIKWGADGFNVDTEGTLINDTASNPHTLSGLSGSTAYDWYVRADNGGGDVSTWVGPSSFTTPLQYPAPTALTSTVTGARTVTLNWTANGEETAWDIEWGESGFTQGSGTTVSSTSDKPYWLTGLNANTAYDWYVRANDGDANTSEWSSVSSFSSGSSALFRDPYTDDTGSWYVSDQMSYWTIDTSGDGSLDFDGSFSFDSYTRWCMVKSAEYQHTADADVTITAEITFSSISPSGIEEPGLVVAANSDSTGGGGFMVFVDTSGNWELLTPDSYFYALSVLNGGRSTYGTVLGSLSETGTHTITVDFDRANASSGQVNVSVTITAPSGATLTHSGTYTDVSTANQIGFRDYYYNQSATFDVELLEVTSSSASSPELSANNGPNAGGNELSIYSGSGLGSGSDITGVTVCGVAASILSQSSNVVTVVLGAAPTTSGTTGDVVIESTSAGTTTVSDAYTYNPAGNIGGTTAQTITLGSGLSTSSSSEGAPLNIFYRSLHCQFIYTKAELEAAGITGPATITAFGYNVVGAPGYDLPGYLIRIKHTSNSDMYSGFESSDLTLCYSNSAYAPVEGGFDVLTLDTPFEWNGTDNLLFDTAFAQVPSYESNGTTKYDYESGRFLYVREDSSDMRYTFSGGTTSGNLPQLQLTVATGSGAGVDPDSGSSSGGYQVTISGTNLGNGSDITNVTICGTGVASIDSQSDTEVVVTLDSTITPGTGDVRVFSRSYGETVETNGFQYIGVQSITLAPTNGSHYVTTSEVALSAEATSGLDVLLAVDSGPGSLSDVTNLSFSATGTVVIVATQAGDTDWYAATPVTNTYYVHGLPVAGPVVLWRAEDEMLKIPDLLLLTNSVDPEGAALSLDWVSATSTNDRTLTLDGRWITYDTPAADTNTDYFAFRIINAYGGTDTAVAEVRVIGTGSGGDQTKNIAEISTQGSDMVVKFIGIPGRTYNVQACTNLSEGAWQNIGQCTIGSDGNIIFTDTNAPSSRFYRTVKP